MPECSQKWKEFQVSPVFSQVYCYLCAWKGESTLVFPPPRKCRFVKAKRLCKRLVWKVQIQGRKKKNEGELQPWENNDKGWSGQREGDDRGRSAVTNESFSSPQQNKKMKGIVTGQPRLHVGELWWTLSASFWMTEVTFIYRKVRNQINISSSHLTVNFQTRYSRRFWGRFPTT